MRQHPEKMVSIEFFFLINFLYFSFRYYINLTVLKLSYRMAALLVERINIPGEQNSPFSFVPVRRKAFQSNLEVNFSIFLK